MGNNKFKSVFSYNTDAEKTAYLNWRTDKHDAIHNLGVMAKGYMDSAIMLLNDAITDNSDKKADLIY